MSGGIIKLAEQGADHLRNQIESWVYFMDSRSEFGATPIERLLMSAVYVTLKHDPEIAEKIRRCDQAGLPEAMTGENAQETIFWVSQFQLPDWRVDFLFSVYSYWPRYNVPPRPEGWRSLIVECDGHDFHERTKEQAARDRSRDRWAQDNGYDVFRFTGSEIWRDPWGCGLQVLRWCEKGW